MLCHRENKTLSIMTCGVSLAFLSRHFVKRRTILQTAIPSTDQ
jgi:hypothetical protein